MDQIKMCTYHLFRDKKIKGRSIMAEPLCQQNPDFSTGSKAKELFSYFCNLSSTCSILCPQETDRLHTLPSGNRSTPYFALRKQIDCNQNSLLFRDGEVFC